MTAAQPGSGIVRTLVVDDEPDARDVVTTMLANHPRIQVIGECTNGRDAVTAVRALKPDLVFLDVQMPDLDGFGMLDALGSDVPRGVVFVTAHDQHAVHAFEMHALDYLLKPFGRPRFDAAVARALDRLQALDALSMQRTLASMTQSRQQDTTDASELAPGSAPGTVAHTDAPVRRIGVRVGNKVVVVPVERIDWIEASGDYVRVHAGADSYVVLQRLHALELMLDPRQFTRVHRSAVVNLQRVRELHRESDGGGCIVLDNSVRLRVARGRWEELQAALEIRTV